MSLLSFQVEHGFPGGFQVDIAFEASRTTTALFGPSGSGKTTVLQLIAGFLRPQSGNIRIADQRLVDTTRHHFLPPERRRVGMVFQDHLLFPHLNVEGNLRYGKRRRGRTGIQIEFEKAVEVLELGPLLKRHPRNLSGGERQRVALGRALLSGPELLLMDEPLSALDAGLKERVLTYLERVIDQWQIPTLFVTHSQAEVRRLADWVIVVDRGRVVTTGVPDDALASPIALAFKNSAGPSNLLKLEDVYFHKDHAHGRVGTQELFVPIENGSAKRAASREAQPPQDRLPPMFVQFSPTEVTVSRDDVAAISARNHLRGKICKVVDLPGGVYLAVDIGQVFWVELTREAVSDLQVTTGDEVTCYLKAHSLHVLG